MMITECPANGFDTRVLVSHAHWTFNKPAWARFTDYSDTVEVIYIRNDGDFGAIINTEPRDRVIIPFV
jgi:hypothetical protein